MAGMQPENYVPPGALPQIASTSHMPPPPPEHVEIPINAEPEKAEPIILALGPVGGFRGKVEPLPAIRIENVEQAGIRLGLLKTRINFLENAVDTNNDMLIMILCCLFLGPLGLCFAFCLSNGSEEKTAVQKESVKCIQQINALRERYQSDPTWPQQEQRVEKIRQSVFSHGVARNLLKGSL